MPRRVSLAFIYFIQLNLSLGDDLSSSSPNNSPAHFSYTGTFVYSSLLYGCYRLSPGNTHTRSHCEEWCLLLVDSLTIK
jgi:hypothetical protein